MNRDGATQSIWQEDMPNYVSKTNILPSVVLFDVVIVGGGITGVSTALQLQKSGKSCLIIEAKTLGFGTTSGTTAQLNTILDTPYYQITKDFDEQAAQGIANLTKKAIQQVKQNVAKLAIDCDYKEVPAYLYAQNQEQNELLDKMIQSAKKVDVDADFTDHIPLPIAFTTAARVEGQAQIHPTKYIYGLAQEFEKAGGVIVQNCRALDVEEGTTLTVVTNLGNVRAKNLIYATHIPPGVNRLHFECAPYRSYVVAVEIENAPYPDAFLYDLDEPYHYYRTQIIDGKNHLIIGGEDHKTAHEENTEEVFEKLIAYVKTYFTVKNIAYKWSSQYFESSDGVPFIGKMPSKAENIYVATGYGGNGITYGVIASLLLTEIILKGKSEYQSIFNPQRLKILAGFTNLVKEGVDVVKDMIGGWISPSKLENLSKLSLNEAKVVKHDHQIVGVYKDELGTIHAVNPACTHIKCAVAWNQAEKSWDCPCHGSRFSFDGEVLTAPATKGLEKIELTDKQEV